MSNTKLEPNPEFDAWKDTLPETHWAKYDLGACRLGFEARDAEIKSMKSERKELEGTIQMLLDCSRCTPTPVRRKAKETLARIQQ